MYTIDQGNILTTVNYTWFFIKTYISPQDLRKVDKIKIFTTKRQVKLIHLTLRLTLVHYIIWFQYNGFMISMNSHKGQTKNSM